MHSRNIQIPMVAIGLFAISLARLSGAQSLQMQASLKTGETVSSYAEPEGGFRNYSWINDNEIIYFPADHGNIQAKKRNLLNGQEEVLSNLSGQLQETKADGRVFVSPSGQLVMWYGGFGELYLGPITGEARTRFSGPISMWALGWTPDNENAVYAEQGNWNEGVKSFHYERSNSLGVSHQYPIVDDCSLHGIWDVWAGFQLPSLRILSGETVMLIPRILWTTKPGEIIDIEKIALAHNMKPVKIYHIRIPHTAKAYDAIISSDGTRVVWKFKFASSLELWLSNIDGGHMRRVGILDAHDINAYNNPSMNDVADLQIEWLPSGEAVSFHLNSVLQVLHLTHE